MGGGGGGEGEGGGGSHAEAEGGTCGLSGMRRAAERGMGTPPFAMSGLARVRAHAHALAHTRTRTHTHTRIRARMHALVCTPAPANTHTHACPRTHTHARTHTHTARPRASMYAHTRARACSMPTRTRAIHTVWVRVATPAEHPRCAMHGVGLWLTQRAPHTRGMQSGPMARHTICPSVRACACVGARGAQGGSNRVQKGLRRRNSPMCTLSQNGYGEN